MINFIDLLKKQNSSYNNPEQAANQANSINALSTDIYTDRTRFIYELLQNADDASATSGSLVIHFKFLKKGLIVSHQGEPFSEIDIESISSVGDGNKQKDDNKTGFKGIGFKSVFSHSSKVIIKSGGYCFGFEKEHWDDYWDDAWGDKEEWKEMRDAKGKSSKVKMPWQIIPFSKKLSEKWEEKLEKFNVSTIIFLPNGLSLIEEVKSLFANSNILLFLRSKNVRVVIEGGQDEIIEKTCNKEGIVTISRNGSVQNSWLTKSFLFDVPESITEALQTDRKIPEKLKEISRTELSFALPIRDEQLINLKSSSRFLFTYLPTAVNYDFPFLLNGNFITDAGRQHFHEDTVWNQWLFEQIPFCLLNWLASFSNTSLKEDILRIVPNKFSGIGQLEQSFNKGLKEAIDIVPFLPNKNGELIKCKDAIFDKDEWCTILADSKFIEFINEDRQVNYTTDSFLISLKPQSKLKELGVYIPDFDLIEKFFKSEGATEFISGFKKNNLALINAFFGQFRKLSESDKYRWLDILRKTNFILDSGGAFCSPKDLFLPNSQFNTKLDAAIRTIHPDLQDELESIEGLNAWLGQLGVKKILDESYLEKVLIPKSSSLVTVENAGEYIDYLFELYKNGNIPDSKFQDLQDFPILTTKRTLKPANQLFLPKFFKPEIDFESVLNEDIFCSSEYVNLYKGTLLEWKSFFLKMGIKEKLITEVFKGDRHHLNSKYNCEWDYFKEKIIVEGYSNYRYHAYRITRISFIEKAIENHSFAKLFWEGVFESGTISTENFKRYTSGYWGWGGMRGARSGDSLEPYNEWILKNRKIIPITTEKCFKPENTFVNTSKITDLVGNHLPIFDYNKPISAEWVEFLGLKTKLTTENLFWTIILISIAEKNADAISKENQEYLFRIYEKLATETLHEDDKKKLEPLLKENIFKLSGADGKFYRPDKLYFINVYDFVITSEYNNIIKAPKNPSKEMIALFKWFGVNIIEEKSLTTSNDAILINSIKDKLIQIVPLLCVLNLKDSTNSWSPLFTFFTGKIEKLKCYKVSNLGLSVQYSDKVIEQKRKVFLSKQKLYYKGKWENPIILDLITNELQPYLTLKKAQKGVFKTLLQVSYEDGLEYLEYLGYDINQIPERTEVVTEPSVILPRTSSFTKIKIEIGRLGEQFTYNKLIEIYESKYEQKVVDTPSGFAISGLVTVIWKNKDVEQKENHDFLIIEGTKKIYLDSKATSYGKQYHTEFELTGSEFNLLENSEYYYIARVFNVNEDFKDTSVVFLRIGKADFIKEEVAVS